jgi:hypothetical protein
VAAREFLYWTDDGSVAALRYKDWKITFLRRTPRASTSGESIHAPAGAHALQPAHGSFRAREHDEVVGGSIGYPRWWVEPTCS